MVLSKIIIAFSPEDRQIAMQLLQLIKVGLVLSLPLDAMSAVELVKTLLI